MLEPCVRLSAVTNTDNTFSTDGVDLTQSSLLQGHGRPPISFPYHPRLSAETQDHWRTLDETQHVPFQCWNGRAIVAWVTTGLGNPTT